MSFDVTKVGSLKEGRYVVHSETNEPCKIISIEKSKPGKHGSAKARIVLVGVFSGKKRQWISPVDARCNVPIIDKRVATVTHLEGDSVGIMDSETYETIDVPLPPDEELSSKLTDLINAGKVAEVDYWNLMDRLIIMNVREGSS
ncbi:MAG: translation initiation factor IF-5A [Candidatus Hodarchaeota archaeon]